MSTVMTITLNTAYDLIGKLDNIKIGGVNYVEPLGLYSAGKGINVARVLKDLGINVAVGGFIGRDNSTHFERMFREFALEDLCQRVNGSTRINVKVTEKNFSVTELNFLGYNITDKEWAEFVESSLKHVKKFNMVAVCGSLPKGVTSLQFSRWLSQLKQTGIKVILDTSLDALKVGVNSKPWLVKPNHHELAFWAGEPLLNLENTIKAAKKLQALGVENVVVSMGEKGAIWVNNQNVILAQPPKCENVISTVGAGDSMVAGIIYGFINSFSLQKTLKFSTALSAFSVSQSHIGISNIGLLEPILKNTKITIIEG